MVNQSRDGIFIILVLLVKHHRVLLEPRVRDFVPKRAITFSAPLSCLRIQAGGFDGFEPREIGAQELILFRCSPRFEWHGTVKDNFGVDS